MNLEATVVYAGQAWARWCLRRLGWTLLNPPLPACKGVLVVYPHTSNWDFPIAMLAKWGLGWPVRFWGKDSLFRWPLLGAWLRWIGGVPVNRQLPHGVVQQTIEAMAASDCFWLGLAPEGTRRYSAGWRTGFYHLLLAVRCPLGVGVIDWSRKIIGIKAFFDISGDINADFATIAAIIGDARGLRPEAAAPIVPIVPRDRDCAQSHQTPPQKVIV